MRLALDLLLLLLLLLRIGTAIGTLHPHLSRRFLLLLLLLRLRRGIAHPAAAFAVDLGARLSLARATIVTGALPAAATIAVIIAFGARLVIVAGIGPSHRRDRRRSQQQGNQKPTHRLTPSNFVTEYGAASP